MIISLLEPTVMSCFLYEDPINTSTEPLLFFLWFMSSLTFCPTVQNNLSETSSTILVTINQDVHGIWRKKDQLEEVDFVSRKHFNFLF